jgi:hypothetical protein
MEPRRRSAYEKESTVEHAVLDYRDGWLCARSEWLESSEPVKVVQWWPLIRDFRQVWEDDLGKPLSYCRNTYTYALKIGGFWREFRLPQGGQTQCLATETVPVERPKRVKLPVHWRAGRWEKETRRG